MKRYCKKLDYEIIPQEEVSLVDQTVNQDFNYNEFHRLRNDISALMAAQSVQEYESIAQRLKVIETKDNMQNLTDEQKFAIIPSRYTQDPTELVAFTEYVTRNHPDLVGIVPSAEKQDDEKRKEIESDKSDVPDGL